MQSDWLVEKGLLLYDCFFPFFSSILMYLLKLSVLMLSLVICFALLSLQVAISLS